MSNKRRMERLEKGLQLPQPDVWFWCEVAAGDFVSDSYRDPDHYGPGGTRRQTMTTIEALANEHPNRFHCVLLQSAVRHLDANNWLLTTDLAQTFIWCKGSRDNIDVGEAWS